MSVSRERLILQAIERIERKLGSLERKLRARENLRSFAEWRSAFAGWKRQNRLSKPSMGSLGPDGKYVAPGVKRPRPMRKL